LGQIYSKKQVFLERKRRKLAVVFVSRGNRDTSHTLNLTSEKEAKVMDIEYKPG
jgi:hypothetical protein